MAEVQFEKFTPPVKEPAQLPLVQELAAKGEGVIASIVADSEEEAKAFLSQLRIAARFIDRSARKRVWEELDGGKVKVGVALGDRITRATPPAEDVTDEPLVEAVEPVDVPAPAPSKKTK